VSPVPARESTACEVLSGVWLAAGSEVRDNRRETLPTYEYLCESCKKSFEVMLTITERAKAHVKCPGCGSKKVSPQLTVFSPKTSRKS
jgi:putative FmdB family regulatory protein